MPASIIAANSRAKAEVPALRFICLSLIFFVLVSSNKFFRQFKVTARFTIFIFFQLCSKRFSDFKYPEQIARCNIKHQSQTS